MTTGQRTGFAVPDVPRLIDPGPVQIADGVARFRDPRFDHLPMPPFPAFTETPRDAGPIPADFPIRPRFSIRSGAAVVEVHLPSGTSLYGTGEQAGPLLRNGERKLCWNTDAFDYTDRTPSLYQSHPYVLAVTAGGESYGIICETTRRCEIDLRSPRIVTFRVPLPTDRSRFAPVPACTIIRRDEPLEVCRALAGLTGYMPMPPRWALGYQQSRWSYEPESKVREIAREFRERKIPCDVLWLDIDYMDGFRCFTFDGAKFPDPGRLFDDLHAMGFKVVCMIDPGLKVDTAYAVYGAGLEGGHFVRADRQEGVSSTGDSGRVYTGKVWPGECAFPDFTNRDARAWWSSLYPAFMSHGIDGVWNDMNEPAVFDVPGKTMPDGNLHDADEELGGPDTHDRYHNIYGMQMVRATREGLSAARPDKRPFVLTRSNFLGGQRFAATWTGDNRSDWRHLRWTIPMILNLSLSGQPFAGPDIGGFVGDADAELFARWMGLGSMLPFARGHSIKDSKPHEPWAFGEACERACREALQRRSRLIPYLYTLFEDASRTGAPVVAPVFFDDPMDPRLRTVDDAFLLGRDMLVLADVSPRGLIDGPTPPSPPWIDGSRWKEFDPLTCDKEKVGELRHESGHGQQPKTEQERGGSPRFFVRVGAAVPIGPVIHHDGDWSLDPLVLVAMLDESGFAAGRLYEDEGDGFAYRDRGYCRTEFQVTRAGGRGDKVLEIRAIRSGEWEPPQRTVRAVAIG